MNYPWYELLSSSKEILQGDMIPECPIIIPPSEIKEGEQIEAQVILKNSIVLSQSCDLENNNVEIVLVCEYMTLSDYLSQLPSEQNNYKGKRKAISGLKQGHQPAYHLINKDSDNNLNEPLVVDFRNVYGIHISFLIEHAEKLGARLRLLPPYREHLSQAFARFFMRVGLPIDIEFE